MLPILGVIGTLYGFAIRLIFENTFDEEFSLVLGHLTFIVIVGFTKALIHWVFNKSESRNIVLNRRIILVLSLYFWYCSYAGSLFDDFFIGDLGQGMLLRISIFELYHLALGYEWYWSIIHIMEFILIVIIYTYTYAEQQEIYCEKCSKYLIWQEYYMMGKAKFKGQELKAGNVKDVLSKMDYLSTKSFKRNQNQHPCLEITYQACKTCDLGVIEIDSGNSVPHIDRDGNPDSQFKKSHTVCHNLIIDKASKEFLGI
ncbi:MAG: hypothetical protein JXR07_14830 [Reichenbachiella sp.]